MFLSDKAAVWPPWISICGYQSTLWDHKQIGFSAAHYLIASTSSLQSCKKLTSTITFQSHPCILFAIYNSWSEKCSVWACFGETQASKSSEQAVMLQPPGGRQQDLTLFFFLISVSPLHFNVSSLKRSSNTFSCSSLTAMAAPWRNYSNVKIKTCFQLLYTEAVFTFCLYNCLWHSSCFYLFSGAL